MPKLSFVIPCYNKQSYISECLNSLIKQTLKDIEIIVVDDCSTDNSLDVVKWLAKKDKRIKIFRLRKNKGRSYARNYGNNKAKSDILCVQDADDISAENRAKTIYEYFKKHPEKDIFYSSFYVSDVYGEPIEEIVAIPFNIENVLKTKVTYIGHSTMAYRKEPVMDIKYSDGKWSSLGLDDWKLQLDLYKAGYKFGFVRKPLMIYRQVSNSISHIRSAVDVYKQKGLYLNESFVSTH